MLNAHFQKVQTAPYEDLGVVTILFDDDGECPENGWETIILDNWSVELMNYGYNLTSDVALMQKVRGLNIVRYKYESILFSSLIFCYQ